MAKIDYTFGVHDSKGREMGYRIEIVAHLNPMSFEVRPQALRDGKKYGAIPVKSRKSFDLASEAETYAHRCYTRTKNAALDSQPATLADQMRTMGRTVPE